MFPRFVPRRRASRSGAFRRTLHLEPLEARVLMADLAIAWTGPGFVSDQAHAALLNPQNGTCDTDFVSSLGMGFGGGGDVSITFGNDADLYAANQGHLYRMDAVTGRIRPWPSTAGGHLAPPLGPNTIEDVSVLLGPNGDLYVASTDLPYLQGAGATKPGRVQRFDSRTGLPKAWPTMLGGRVADNVQDISIAFGPRGDLFVAYTTFPGQGDGYLVRLDANTGLVKPWERTDVVLVGRGMEDISIAAAADGDLVLAGSYFANDGSGRLSGGMTRIDAFTGRSVPWPTMGTLPLGKGIDDPNVVITTDGDILVASIMLDPSGSARTGCIQRFDLRTGLANPWPFVPGGYFGPSVQHFTIATGRLDSDEDGLPDAWERRGIDVNFDGTVDLDLPALGARPDHKDLFVEVDALTEDLNGNGVLDPGEDQPNGVLEAREDLNANGVSDPGEDRPNGILDRMAPWRRNAAGTIVVNHLDDVVAAFAGAPVLNPDGTHGIALHVLSDEDDLPLTPWPDGFDDFDRTKASHFGSLAERNDANWPQILRARSLVYRYCVFAGTHSRGSSSGLAEMPGDDFMVTLWAWNTPGGTPDQQRGTFMHELGHTLNLRHGGGDNINYKPNYHSVMNYTWQMPQVANAGSWMLDYSHDSLPSLDENNLSEISGVGFSAGTVHATHQVPAGPLPVRLVNEVGPVDWSQDDRDGDGIANNDTGIAADVNLGDHNQDGRINVDDATPGEVLHGYDDWSQLWYRMRGTANFFDGRRVANSFHHELTCQEFLALQAATGEFPAGSVQGTVWDDPNRNGLRDRGERGLEGWTVYVDSNNNGCLDGGEPSTVTNNDGTYALTGLSAGTHFVREMLKPEWRQTFPAPLRAHQLSMGAGEVLVGIDFGNWYVGSDVCPWQNQPLRYDANDDTHVSPLDALVVINRLTRQGAGRLPDPPSDRQPTTYYDVNGDEFITPLDALLVINYLTAGRGEGEDTSVATDVMAATVPWTTSSHRDVSTGDRDVLEAEAEDAAVTTAYGQSHDSTSSRELWFAGRLGTPLVKAREAAATGRRVFSGDVDESLEDAIRDIVGEQESW